MSGLRRAQVRTYQRFNHITFKGEAVALCGRRNVTEGDALKIRPVCPKCVERVMTKHTALVNEARRQDHTIRTVWSILDPMIETTP